MPEDVPSREDKAPEAPGAAPAGRKSALLSGGAIAVVVALFAILAASLWLAARTWIATAGAPMNIHGYIAMTLGVVFSLVVGCGLMALVFYSSRYGYDEESYRQQSWPQGSPRHSPQQDSDIGHPSWQRPRQGKPDH